MPKPSTELAPLFASSRDLALSQVATAILTNLRGTGMPVAPDQCPAAQALAARARSAMHAATANTAESIAEQMAVLRTIRLDPKPIAANAVRFEHAVNEIKIKNADQHRVQTLATSARVSVTAYEQEYPRATLWQASARRIAFFLASLAGADLVGGTYFLQQNSNIQGGFVTCGLVLAFVVAFNFELGTLGARFAGHPYETRLKRALGWAMLALATGLALTLDLAVGCLRTALPLSPASIVSMASDVVQFLPSWMLSASELALYAITASLAFGREKAGDTAHYQRLRSAQLSTAATAKATRSSIEADINGAIAHHRQLIGNDEVHATGAMSAATECLQQIQTAIRNGRVLCETIRSEKAALYGQARAIALSDAGVFTHGSAGDVERSFLKLLPLPAQDAALVGEPLMMARKIRQKAHQTGNEVELVRAKLDSTREATLQELYS